MKALFAFALIVTAYLMVQRNDQQAEQRYEPVRLVEIRPNPLDAPRCPKFNAAGEPLLNEVAMQADGGDWTHACEYQGGSR